MCMVSIFGTPQKATGCGSKIFGDADCSGRYLCTDIEIKSLLD